MKLTCETLTREEAAKIDSIAFELYITRFVFYSILPNSLFKEDD